MNAREYLASKGLAKPNSRGRFSREAIAELARAKAAGMTFDEKPAIVKPTKSTIDNADNTENAPIVKPKPATSQITAPVPLPAPEKQREESVVWGVDKSDHPGHKDIVIAFDSCAACRKQIQYCACNDGPQLPKYIGGGNGLFVKPEVSNA